MSNCLVILLAVPSVGTLGEFGTESKPFPEVLQSLVASYHINPGLYHETGVEI